MSARRRRWPVRVLFTVLLLSVLLLVGTVAVCYATTGQDSARSSSPWTSCVISSATPAQFLIAKHIDLHTNRLSILTLNLAHGRANKRHQILQSGTSIRANLVGVVDFLRPHTNAVICLQEADFASWWSGDFNHVGVLDAELGLSNHRYIPNVHGLGLSYGTAMASNHGLYECEGLSGTFDPSPPTFSKGFCGSRIVLLYRGEQMRQRYIDVVSVHLDFSRRSVRRKQAAQLVESLGRTSGDRVLILAGDFNCDWDDKGSVLPTLCRELKLKAYQPEAEGMETFDRLGKRLDWILIDERCEFANHITHEVEISDHKPVSCEVILPDPE